MREAWKENILHCLFPRTCENCLADLPRWAQGPLCRICLGRLASVALSPPIRSISPPGAVLERVVATFPYIDPLPRLVHAFKYENRLPVGEALGDWQAGFFPRFPELAGADALVPVPLHPKRERERGFNQAEILARRVARIAGMPVLNALVRRANTNPQWSLSPKERKLNLKQAFAAAPFAPISGKSLILIDDVCTTGETLRQCAKVLKAAGARRVYAYVLAKD